MTRTLTFVFLLICSTVLMAQSKKVMPLSFTPKIGINFTDLIIDDNLVPTSTFSKLGYNIGVDASYGNRLQARGGLHLFRLGSGLEIKKNSFAEPIKERVSASQIKLPVGVSYKVWNVEYFTLWVQAQVVANITTNMKNTSAGYYSNKYPRGGFSGRAGVGIDLARFSLELNYEQGFTDLIQELFNARSELVALAIGIRI